MNNDKFFPTFSFGESEANRIMMKAIGKTQKNYPSIKFHLYSGNAQYVEEQLDQGIFDLGIVTDPVDLSKYDYLKLPTLDTWGVLMKKDSELAKLDTISPKDLLDKPMIISNQEMVKNGISGWLGGNQRALNVVTTYNLFYNAMLMCEERCKCTGYRFNTCSTGLCFNFKKSS
ncbi:LysR family transcriptional regulator substrate-binding protein [Faecalibacillus faecis]|uniref:LysR family transcriptional regulator substrate-binding protein n=1 Tax=Faecalibacillus faecis TaxID=1982628 RepID=UPI002961ED77|nr:LysR family transcriptional regulator substrate-binding protein [Faecalibacillus faecis]